MTRSFRASLRFAGIALGLAGAWALALAPAGAETVEGVGRDAARLEVIVEPPATQAFEQEMLLVRIRGTYTVTMTLQELEQPAFTDFAWMQLGRDRWIEINDEGRSARRFERVMALFPRRPGRLTVPPFVHRLTLLTPGGGRARHDVPSDPVEIEVRAAATGSDWWLPARSLTLQDTTDRDPATLAPGEIVTRTVVLEAEGVSADRLPPMPSLRTPGAVALPAPEARETRATPQGPVARVVWTWRLKPLGAEPVRLPSATFGWYDTVAREPRRLVLSELALGRAGTRAAPEPGWRDAAIRHGGWLAAAAGLLGVGLGALALGGSAGTRRERRLALTRLRALVTRLGPDPIRRVLRRAARRGDAAAFRSELARVAAACPDGPESAALSNLDRGLFGGADGPVELEEVLGSICDKHAPRKAEPSLR